MARETTLNFRTWTDLREDVEAEAKREKRSLGDMCNILLQEAIDRRRAKKVKQ
jgi:hypothetical protein